MFITKRKNELITKSDRSHSNKIEKKMQHRNSKGFFKYILNYSLIAATVLAVVIIAGITAQAQNRGYWATDGCYYQAYGNRWQRVECRYYDKQGTLVAQNSNGTFYWFNGQWHNIQSYTLAQLNEMINRSQAAQNQAIINEFMRSNGGPNGTVNLPRAIGNRVSAPWMRSRRPRY